MLEKLVFIVTGGEKDRVSDAHFFFLPSMQTMGWGRQVEEVQKPSKVVPLRCPLIQLPTVSLGPETRFQFCTY